jgi:hypothetical protein
MHSESCRSKISLKRELRSSYQILMQPTGTQNIRRLAIVVGILLALLCVSWLSEPVCKERCLSRIFDWIETVLFMIAMGGLVCAVLSERFQESVRFWAQAMLAIEGLSILTGIIFIRIRSCGLNCPTGGVFVLSVVVALILNPILAITTLLHLPSKTT